MKKVLISIVITGSLAVCAVSAKAQPVFREPLNELTKSQSADRALALGGDYNAMRNLAYSYAATVGSGAKSKVAGCAWYLLVPVHHRQKFHGGDSGNIAVYCNKLSHVDFDVAYDYAFRKLVIVSKP